LEWYIAHDLFLDFFIITIVVLRLHITFCSYPKVAISKHFTVNQAQTMKVAQRLI
jgi:hypothetical protein